MTNIVTGHQSMFDVSSFGKKSSINLWSDKFQPISPSGNQMSPSGLNTPCGVMVKTNDETNYVLVNLRIIEIGKHQIQIALIYY